MDSWKETYNKHREAISYLFFGALTTLVSILSLALLTRLFLLAFDLNTAVFIANFCSNVISITFAYVTNRRYVFQSKAQGRAIWAEMASFYLGRGVTFALDMLLMALLVTILNVRYLFAKTLVTVLVIVVNYVIAKLFVFKSKNSSSGVKKGNAADL